VKREFVSLGPRAGHGSYRCQGIYYGEPGARVAFIATHYDIDFSEHYLADYMAARGFGFLGWNTRFRGNGSYFILEPALEDIGAGVRWLRDNGAEIVVILGNSGGASLMSAYQARADDKADLFISLCAHPGRPEVHTAWIDPSVTDENDPFSVDPSLDMFNPENGPPYAPGFVERYRAAQTARNERITAWAQAELRSLEERGLYDRMFNIFRVWADLRFNDLSIDPSERDVGCYFGDAKRANYGPFGIGCTSTMRSWLSMWSLETSNCRGAPNLAKVSVPSLVIQSTGDQGVYPSDARSIYDALGSSDKDLIFTPGDHYLLEPDGARAAVADLIADWLRERTA
jgi:pimeloyl-ACP methyl ester carboxylesterase